MLIKGILSIVLIFLEFIFSAVNIPDFSSEFIGYLENAIEYFQLGYRVLGYYVDLPYIWSLFKIFLGVWIAYELYLLLMWVLRKIPMLGIK